ncbi:MAG: hypothetical protein ACKOEE_08190, partial [Tagaea sp.]
SAAFVELVLGGRARVEKGELYPGLKDAKRLIKFEWDLLGKTTDKGRMLLQGSEPGKGKARAAAEDEFDESG